MIRLAGAAVWARLMTGVVMLSAPVRTAHAMPPRPTEPPTSATVVERIEVPVPVDDTSTEIEQMVVAAALAATAASAVTRARLRRRYDRPANTMIDITDSHTMARTADDRTDIKKKWASWC